MLVATVPTACGIETVELQAGDVVKFDVATVPTACGIETYALPMDGYSRQTVATVPTACGIETIISPISMANTPGKLQQCLPLAVLKQLYHPYQWRIYQVSCNSAYRLRY